MKLKNLVSICLLAMAATANAVWAQVQAAPPLSGVIGAVQSFTGSSLEVMTKSGFDDLIRAYPPMSQAKWARVESSAPSAGARKTWLKKCEGHYQDWVFRGSSLRIINSAFGPTERRPGQPSNMLRQNI